MTISKPAVLLITYRKSEYIHEILTAINAFQPPTLYIFQNKEKNANEAQLTAKVTEEIKHFKYEQPLVYQQHSEHLNLNESVQKSIDSVFQHENELIILEDDIVPTPSFFEYCSVLLRQFQDNPNIGVINGCNLNAIEENGIFLSDYSLPFWGWATWRDRWSLFRPEEINWKEIKQNMHGIQSNRGFFSFFFKNIVIHETPWDVQWSMILNHHQLKTVLPCTNLIVNKGFHKDGTYTNYVKSKFKQLKTDSMTDYHLVSLKKNKTFNKKYHGRTALFLKEILKNLKAKPFSRLNIILSSFHLR